MLFDNLLKVFVTSLTLSSSSFVLANQKIDQAKVQKYKDIFADVDASTTTNDSPNKTFDPAVFESSFRWDDVVHGAWWFSGCQPSCQACPSGCNLACCVRHPFPWPPSPPPPPSKSPSSGKTSNSKPTPTPATPPKSPLGCPCTCDDDCPPSIKAVCCAAPESKSSKDKKENNDSQKPLELNKQHPEMCPCHCEASCPTWIQAICCDTPGSGSSDSEASEATKPSDEKSQIGLIMQTSAGDPVTVLATTNLTVEQSFVTLDLVRGLGRLDEVQHDSQDNIFQIILDVIVGSGSGPAGDKEAALKQSFQVIDGSRLFEQEQILLGVKFLARIGGLEVEKSYVGKGLEDGLKIETGESPNQKDKVGHDEL